MKYKKGIFIIVGVFLYICISIIFYPPIYGISDEAGYLGMAQVLQRGTIFPDVAGFNVVGSVQTNTHFVSKWPIGNPLLILPFLHLHWKAIFLLPLLLHLLGFFVFLLICKEVKIDPIFSLIYLFFPAFLLYSRTILSDFSSVFVFITAFYLYLKGGKWLYLAGFLFGFSILIRYANLLLFLPFLIAGIWGVIGEKNKENTLRFYGLLRLVTGLLPLVIFHLFYNKIAFGSPFGVPAGDINYFRIDSFFRNFGYYILSLSLLYPGMFFGIFSYRGKCRCELISTSLLFIVFYSFYSYIFPSPKGGFIGSLVVGMRFLLPVIPLFLISYSSLLDSIGRMRNNKVIFAIMFLFILLFDVGMIYKHQTFLDRQKDIKDLIYEKTTPNSIIITNNQGEEFFQPVWGDRKYIRLSDWIIKRRNIEVADREVYLLVVRRSDKTTQMYNIFRIRQAFNDTLIAEIKGDPSLKIYRLDAKP